MCIRDSSQAARLCWPFASGGHSREHPALPSDGHSPSPGLCGTVSSWAGALESPLPQHEAQPLCVSGHGAGLSGAHISDVFQAEGPPGYSLLPTALERSYPSVSGSAAPSEDAPLLAAHCGCRPGMGAGVRPPVPLPGAPHPALVAECILGGF